MPSSNCQHPKKKYIYIQQKNCDYIYCQICKYLIYSKKANTYQQYEPVYTIKFSAREELAIKNLFAMLKNKL